MLPELDQEGWTTDDFVRDMPVDYTLLVENLLDPGGQSTSAPVLLDCDKQKLTTNQMFAPLNIVEGASVSESSLR